MTWSSRCDAATAEGDRFIRHPCQLLAIVRHVDHGHAEMSLQLLEISGDARLQLTIDAGAMRR
jgi:hypothetical protein